MAHVELQEAIKRFSTDADYRKSLVADSEKIMTDYGLDKNGMLAIQSIKPAGVKKQEMRAIALCCTCWAAE